MRSLEKLFRSDHFHLIAIIALAISIVLVYSNTLHSTFHYDDFASIVDNERIRHLDNIVDIFTKGNRGITYYSFALNYALGGFNVEGYHLVNTAIHIVNAILLYLLLVLTFKRLSLEELWSKRVAFFSALIFAVHPIQTQSVTYIVQRMESLSALFFLASLLFFALATAKEKGGVRWLYYVLVPVSYVLSFYSKEIAITLPAVVLLYDIYFTGERSLRSIISRWPLYAVLGVLLAYFTISTVAPLGGFNDLSLKTMGVSSSEHIKAAKTTKTAHVEKFFDSFSLVSTAHAADAVKKEDKFSGPKPTAGFGMEHMSAKKYLITEFNVLTYYMMLLALPMEQNLNYDFPASTSLFATPIPSEGTIFNTPIPPPIVSLVVLLVIVLIAFYFLLRSGASLRPRGLIVSFFIFWFFIVLSPTSSVIPIVDVIFEHRVYTASAGFFVIEVILIDWLVGLVARRGEGVSGEAIAKP